MKRFLVCLCIALIALSGIAFAERSNKDVQVAQEIARQLEANFDTVSFFDGTSWYDEDMDAIVLKINVTDNMSHEGFMTRRAEGRIEIFYSL